MRFVFFMTSIELLAKEEEDRRFDDPNFKLLSDPGLVLEREGRAPKGAFLLAPRLGKGGSGMAVPGG